MTDGSIITNNGKITMLNRAFKASPDYTAPTVFKVGIENGTPSVTSTDLDHPIPISGVETVNDCEDHTNFTAGTDSALSDNATTYKQGNGSISIAKSGTSGTTFSMSGTVTSLDFANKKLSTWLYILDITDLVTSGTAVSIRYGNDGSNYWQYDIDIGSLANGWNLFEWEDGDASSSTGSPSTTACDYYAIILNTDLAADTVAADRVVVDDLKLISSDDYTKTYVSGYPLIDETNKEVETQMYLTSVEANGYDINGAAMFNTDSTPLMFSEDTFTAESKSNTDEFVIVAKDRLV